MDESHLIMSNRSDNVITVSDIWLSVMTRYIAGVYNYAIPLLLFYMPRCCTLCCFVFWCKHRIWFLLLGSYSLLIFPLFGPLFRFLMVLWCGFCFLMCGWRKILFLWYFWEKSLWLINTKVNSRNRKEWIDFFFLDFLICYCSFFRI